MSSSDKSSPELKISERDETLNPRQLRQAGYIPVTIQGGSAESLHVQIKTHELELVLAKKPADIKLSGAGFEGLVVLQAVQKEPVSQKLLQVTFLKPGKPEKKPKAAAPKKAATTKAASAKAEKVEEPVTV